jgi:hypothetical protein
LNPADDHLRLQVALHQLLVGIDGAAAEKTLAAGAAAFADTQLYRVASALAALRREQPDLALQQLDGLAWNPNSPPLWRVIQAGALGAAGMHAEARQAAHDLDPGQLSAPEFSLVKAWLR